MGITRRFLCLFLLLISIQTYGEVNKDINDSTRLEAFRTYMNDLQNAKIENDTALVLKAYSDLSNFYILNGIPEKSRYYKEAQLNLLLQSKPLDSAKLYLARNELQGVYYSNGDKIDREEIYRIMEYAIRHEEEDLKENCHSLYRSYLMQNDLFTELSQFYEVDYPAELEAIKNEEYDNYVRIRASLFEFHGQIDSSLHYLNLVESLIKENPNKYFIAKYYIRFGQFFERQQRYEEAIDMYLISMEYSEEVGYRPFLLEATSRMEELYSSKGDYQSAFNYAQKSMEYKDEINRIANRDELLKLEIKKENELNELEIQKKDLAAEARLNKEKTTKWISIFSGIVLLLLALGLWSRMRYVGRVNHLLKSAKIKAEQGERLKQQFLANMSHEIRTPMNAILGMSNLMLETEIDEKQRNYLLAIKSSCENLLVIINDVLDLSKLEAGKMELEKIPFKVNDQIKIVYDTLRFKAEEKSLKCETEVGADIPDMLIGDPSRLNQVLINLCGNAIKFTEKGGVKLRVEKAEEGDGSLRFIVSDTGIGISEDMISNVFSSFQQADLSTSRKYGGTGLGLSISKTLVELQGGSIEVKSVEGKGSEFSFIIPYEIFKEDDGVRDTLLEVDHKKLLKGLRILVAEDNEFNQIVINDTLIKLIDGVSVDIAENGKIVVEKLITGAYDVILMDVNMPEMDGHEATKAIRKLDDAKKDIPIIALTASVLKSEVQKCMDSGMNAFVPKPFNKESLLKALTDVLGKAK